MKKIFVVFLSLVLCFNMCNVVLANTSDTYSVDYYPGAPGGVGNQSDFTYINYYSGNWRCNTTSYSGSNGSYLDITGMHTAGITSSLGNSYVRITTTGYTVTWVVNGSWTTGSIVTHRVAAIPPLRACSTGVISHV